MNNKWPSLFEEIKNDYACSGMTTINKLYNLNSDPVNSRNNIPGDEWFNADIGSSVIFDGRTWVENLTWVKFLIERVASDKMLDAFSNEGVKWYDIRMRQKITHEILYRLCLGLVELDIPAYVLLEIANYLTNDIELGNESERYVFLIKTIIKIKNSITNIKK